MRGFFSRWQTFSSVFLATLLLFFLNPNFHLTKRLLVVDSSVHENCGKLSLTARVRETLSLSLVIPI